MLISATGANFKKKGAFRAPQAKRTASAHEGHGNSTARALQKHGKALFKQLAARPLFRTAPGTAVSFPICFPFSPICLASSELLSRAPICEKPLCGNPCPAAGLSISISSFFSLFGLAISLPIPANCAEMCKLCKDCREVVRVFNKLRTEKEQECTSYEQCFCKHSKGLCLLSTKTAKYLWSGMKSGRIELEQTCAAPGSHAWSKAGIFRLFNELNRFQTFGPHFDASCADKPSQLKKFQFSQFLA